MAPSEAVKQAKAAPKYRDIGVQDALRRLAKCLARANTLLDSKLDRIEHVPAGVLKMLDDGALLIRRVQKIAKAKAKEK